MGKVKQPKIAIIPTESGEKDGVPFVKAMIVKGPARTKIPKDAPKNFYRLGQLAEPYLKPTMLAEFLLNNPTHAICVSKKARMVAGLGIKVITRFNERDARITVRKWERSTPEERKEQELSREGYKEAKEKLATAKIEVQRLRNFIEDLCDDTTTREILERGWGDFEAFGNMNWEILRDEDDEPARANHISALHMRVARDHERFAYVTPPYTTPVYFKRYGDPRHLNARTGEWREWKGNPDEDGFDAGKDWGKDEATEVLRYISYHPQDPYYGIPGWYSAMADMIGGAESRDFMLRFFTDKAVPLYAVLLEGGSWSPVTISTIEKFFRRDLVGNYHATLALEVPTGGKITFQQVSPEPRWWPFILKYRDAVRDVIVSVHGLSPSIVGVIESAHLGGGTGSQQIETVKTTEIRPRQETLEWLLNTQLVRRGLGLSLVMIKLDEIDTVDEQQVYAAVATLYSTPPRPALTLNDARKMLRLDPVEAAWADMILIQDPQFGFLPLDDMEQSVRQAQKAQQVAGQMGGQEMQPQQQGPNTPMYPGGAPGGSPADDFQSLLDQYQQGNKSIGLRDLVRRSLYV
jgi:capsid portal protein